MPADLGLSDHQIHFGLMDQRAKRQKFFSGEADGRSEIAEGGKIKPLTLSAGCYQAGALHTSRRGFRVAKWQVWCVAVRPNISGKLRYKNEESK